LHGVVFFLFGAWRQGAASIRLETNLSKRLRVRGYVEIFQVFERQQV